MKVIRMIVGYVFGLIAETFARLTLLADEGYPVNFDYLRKEKNK